MEEGDSLAVKHIQKHQALLGEKTNWQHTWQDCSDYCLPRKSSFEARETEGEIRNYELWDTTAIEAAEVFAAGFLSWVCPAGEIWFRLEPQGDAPEEAKEWWSMVSELMLEVLMSSNFYLAIHEDIMESGVFGTSCLMVEEGETRPIRFENRSMNGVTIAEDHEGRPVYVYLEWEWTAIQAAGAFGEENLGKTIQKALANDKEAYTKKFPFLMCIEPREIYAEGLTIGKNRPIAKIIIDVQNKKVVEEDGYYEHPAIVSRFLKSNTEKYGRSPAMSVLPEIKSVNQMEYDIQLALELMVNPPWVKPSKDAYVPDNRPGGVTLYNPNLGDHGIPKQQQYVNRIDLGEMKTEQKRNRIRRAWFNDMFRMLTNPDEVKRDKTAFETMQMMEEKLILFSPIFSYYVDEKTNPCLERVFQMMFRAGAFGTPPASVIQSGGQFKISYLSKIALAIKALQNRNLFQALELIRVMMEINEDARFILDYSQASRDALRNLGLPPDWVHTKEEVKQMVEQNQAMQQMAMAAEQMKTMGQGVGALPEEAQREMMNQMAG
jgi:predicted RNase H-like HicB family nuclease